jgi:hypothetical protein
MGGGEFGPNRWLAPTASSLPWRNQMPGTWNRTGFLVPSSWFPRLGLLLLFAAVARYERTWGLGIRPDPLSPLLPHRSVLSCHFQARFASGCGRVYPPLR